MSCIDQNSSNYHLSDNQTIFIISQILSGVKPEDIHTVWKFDRDPPNVKSINNLVEKVKETGPVFQRKGQGHPITITTQELENKIESENGKNKI